MVYFKHEKLSERIYRIIDITGVCCYLVIGDDRACLLDTCNGIGNIKTYVEQMTDLPIIVILTHGHLDHMGGAGLFDEVYMNHDDMPVFHKHGDMQFRIEDTNAHSPMQIDAEIFIPTYQGDIQDIQDNDCFDLGGITIQMILVKGHTPGMMCPLIKEERTIIFFFFCGVGVLLFDKFSSSVLDYQKSLICLKEYENDYDIIYRNHGTFTSHKELLDNVIECCDLILTRQDAHFPILFHGIQLYACHETKTNGQGRRDGKEGNILYSLDKVK